MISIARRAVSKAAVMLEMIKFEHTVFALPFALTSALLAQGIPPVNTILWILVAMVAARSAAMAFNRLVDADYDSANPRTAGRALPSGLVKRVEVIVFTVVSSGVFILAASILNRLALVLSPVALVVILGYSYTKRFTMFSHLVLGLALGIAPAGAWIAVTGRLDLAPILLSGAVIFWTAGFDIIYALQDTEFDRKVGLLSIPSVFGASRALFVSRALHLGAVVLLAGFGIALRAGPVYYVGVALTAALLAYEQSLVRPNDLSRVNVAFFNANGLVSIGYFVFAVADALLRGALI